MLKINAKFTYELIFILKNIRLSLKIPNLDEVLTKIAQS